MIRISQYSALCGALLLLAQAAAADDHAKMSIHVQTDDGKQVSIQADGDWLQGLIQNADVECEADHDRETRAMMASLERQGDPGIYRGKDDDGDPYTARRSGGSLRIEKPGEDGERTLIEMPWEAAECLMSGIPPKGELAERIARGDARLRLEIDGQHGSKVSIRIE